jgi:hypothetical protein
MAINKGRWKMLLRFAICLVAILAAGCTTYRSTPLSRDPCNGLSKDSCTPVKGVPIAVKVPTHLDVYVDETFFLLPDSSGIYREVPILDDNGVPVRNLGIRPEMIQTRKIFVVDFKRAAAGVTSNGLEFNDEQYLEKITGSIQDDTLKEATAAFSALAPLLNARPTAAAGETTKRENSIRGTRVVAYRRFDLSTCDFEQQVADFVDYHMNACHTCTGPTYPGVPQLPYSGSGEPGETCVASSDTESPSSRRK